MPSAKVAPLERIAAAAVDLRPQDRKWTLIDTCFSTHHLYFGNDANNTLWTSAGGAGRAAWSAG